MTDETTPKYDDELVTAVRAAQLRITTEEVPDALAVRLERAQAAREAGVREWWTAGNREVREIETPHLRTAPTEELKTSGHPSGRPANGARRRRSTKK